MHAPCKKEAIDQGWYIKFVDYLAWKGLGPTLEELR
jgi:hypothetical protein